MIRNTSNCIRNSFDIAKEQMDLESLAWYAALDDVAMNAAENMAALLSSLVVLMSGPKCNCPDDEQLQSILWGLAEQAGTVSALIQISSEAKCRLSESTKKSDGQ